MFGCKITKPPMTHTDTAPYVQLKDGTNVTAPSVKTVFKFFRGSKIMANGKEYKPRDVMFYSTGKKNYARVPKSRNKFASQVAAGPVNLFRYQTKESDNMMAGGGMGGGMGHGMAGGAGHTHTVNHFYIQSELNEPLQPYSYKNIRALIPSGSAGSKELDGYVRGRRVSRAIGYSALGLLGGGALAIAAGGVGGALIGGGMIVLSVPTYFAYVIARGVNSTKLMKAVIAADKNAPNTKKNPKVKPRLFHDPLLEDFEP